MRTSLITTVTIVLCCLGQATAWPQVGSPPPEFSLENARKVGSVSVDKGQVTGSCFMVDPRGYAVTCLSNIRDCKEAYLQFDGRTKLPIAGFVAASRGLDLVILQVSDIPKDDARFRHTLELRPDVVPAVDESMVPWGGVFTSAPARSINLPKVVRILRGDEFCMGLSSAVDEAYGKRADGWWMWLSQSRHLSCNGAPVFNSRGHVVGILSAGPLRQPQIYSALHIQHVMELIPDDDPKPKSLKLLKNWIDPVVSPKSISTGSQVTPHQIDQSLANNLQYGLPLAERYELLLNHTERAMAEKTDVEQATLTKSDEELALVSDNENLQLELNKIIPEEPYKALEKVEVPERKKVTETVRDADGKTREVRRTITEMTTVTREVTKMRHSPRQLQQMEGIKKKVNANNALIEGFQLKSQYESVVHLPFINEIVRHQEDALFFQADPLGLRPLKEHEELASKLSEIIEQGNGNSRVYVARAMSRINLGQYQEAIVDLKAAYDIDTKIRPLTRTLHARIVGLQGSPDKAHGTLKGLLRDSKESAALLTLAARMEMDRNANPAAVRHLQQAVRLSPGEIELHLGLAWLISQSNGNTKLGLDMAASAVEQTAYRDWNALSALASVYACQKKFDLARIAIEAAVHVAPPTSHDLCQSWQADIEAGNAIKRNWK